MSRWFEVVIIAPVNLTNPSVNTTIEINKSARSANRPPDRFSKCFYMLFPHITWSSTMWIPLRFWMIIQNVFNWRCALIGPMMYVVTNLSVRKRRRNCKGLYSPRRWKAESEAGRSGIQDSKDESPIFVHPCCLSFSNDCRSLKLKSVSMTLYQKEGHVQIMFSGWDFFLPLPFSFNSWLLQLVLNGMQFFKFLVAFLQNSTQFPTFWHSERIERD